MGSLGLKCGWTSGFPRQLSPRVSLLSGRTSPLVATSSPRKYSTATAPARGRLLFPVAPAESGDRATLVPFGPASHAPTPEQLLRRDVEPTDWLSPGVGRAEIAAELLFSNQDRMGVEQAKPDVTTSILKMIFSHGLFTQQWRKKFIQPLFKYLKQAQAHICPWRVSPWSLALPAWAVPLHSAVTVLLIKLPLSPLFFYNFLAYLLYWFLK